MKRFLWTPGMLNQVHYLPPPAPHHRVKSKFLIHQDTHSSFYTPFEDTASKQSWVPQPGIPVEKPVNIPHSPRPQGHS